MSLETLDLHQFIDLDIVIFQEEKHSFGISLQGHELAKMREEREENNKYTTNS